MFLYNTQPQAQAPAPALLEAPAQAPAPALPDQHDCTIMDQREALDETHTTAFHGSQKYEGNLQEKTLYITGTNDATGGEERKNLHTGTFVGKTNLHTKAFAGKESRFSNAGLGLKGGKAYDSAWEGEEGTYSTFRQDKGYTSPTHGSTWDFSTLQATLPQSTQQATPYNGPEDLAPTAGPIRKCLLPTPHTHSDPRQNIHTPHPTADNTPPRTP